MGLGYEFFIWGDKSLAVDYAFAWPIEVEGTIGSHKFGLTLRFQ